MEEEKQKLLSQYDYKNIEYPCGWKEEILHPKDTTKDYISKFLKYIIQPYSKKISNWDQDLLSVATGQKPLCLIDNDNYNDKTLDTFLRHNLVNMKIVYCLNISSDFEEDFDTGNIYFNKEYFDNALLLYLYHKNMINTKYFKQSQDEFQSILLGYSFESYSIYIHTQLLDNCIINFMQSNFPLDEKEIEKQKEIYQNEYPSEDEENINLNVYMRYWNNIRLMECLSNLNDDKLLQLYSRIYKILSKSLKDDRVGYENLRNFIEEYKKDLKNSKYYMLKDLLLN